MTVVISNLVVLKPTENKDYSKKHVCRLFKKVKGEGSANGEVKFAYVGVLILEVYSNFKMPPKKTKKTRFVC